MLDSSGQNKNKEEKKEYMARNFMPRKGTGALYAISRLDDAAAGVCVRER